MYADNRKLNKKKNVKINLYVCGYKDVITALMNSEK